MFIIIGELGYQRKKLSENYLEEKQLYENQKQQRW
jgi:hypothetical protein